MAISEHIGLPVIGIANGYNAAAGLVFGPYHGSCHQCIDVIESGLGSLFTSEVYTGVNIQPQTHVFVEYSAAFCSKVVTGYCSRVI